jgi:hypothetical protein
MASKAEVSAKAKRFKKEAQDGVDWDFFLLDRIVNHRRENEEAPLDGFEPFSLSKGYRKGQQGAAFRKYQSLIEELTELEKNDSLEARERRDIVRSDIQQMHRAFNLLLQYEKTPDPDTMSLREVQIELQKRHLAAHGVIDVVRQRLKDANNSLLNEGKGIIKFVQTRDLCEMNSSHLLCRHLLTPPSSQNSPKTLGEAKKKILALAASKGSRKSLKSRTYKKKHKSKRKSKCKSKCKRKCKQTAKNKLKRKYKNTHKSKRRCKRQCTIKCKKLK